MLNLTLAILLWLLFMGFIWVLAGRKENIMECPIGQREMNIPRRKPGTRKLVYDKKTRTIKQIKHNRIKRFFWKKHSEYTFCFSCRTFGVNMPKDPALFTPCGNCGSKLTIKFYPFWIIVHLRRSK